MKRLFWFIILLFGVSALNFNVIEPTNGAELGHGLVLAKVYFVNQTDEENITIQDAVIKATLTYKTGVLIESKTMVFDGEHYIASFQIDNKGEYRILFETTYDGVEYKNSTEFSVVSSRLFVSIIEPKNETYEEGIEVKVYIEQDNAFAHDVDVKAVVENGSGMVLEQDVPEGQNYYRTYIGLDPGYYTLILNARKGEEEETKSVSFTIAGATIPTKDMEIVRVQPSLGKYPLMSNIPIEVMLIDENGNRVRDPSANVMAIIKSGSEEENITLKFVDSLVTPKYVGAFKADKNAWYEIEVIAEREGYKEARGIFPAIRVGEEPKKPPEGMVETYGLWISIVYPEEEKTYSVDQGIEFRIQILDNESYPVRDANVTVRYGEETKELVYDRNGEYYTTVPPLDEGTYDVSFRILYNGK